MEDTVYMPGNTFSMGPNSPENSLPWSILWKTPILVYYRQSTRKLKYCLPYFKWAQPEQGRAKHLMVDSNGSYPWRAVGSERPIHGSTLVNPLTTNEWRLQETHWVLATIWITLLRKQHQCVWDCIRRAHVNGRSFLSFVCWNFLTPASFTFISCFLQNEMVSLFGCDFFHNFHFFFHLQAVTNLPALTHVSRQAPPVPQDTLWLGQMDRQTDSIFPPQALSPRL